MQNHRPKPRREPKRPRIWKTESKITKINKILENRMGVLVRNRAGLVVSIYGEDEQRLVKQFAYDPHKTIAVLGMCNSSGNLLVAEHIIQMVGLNVSRNLHIRDLQLEMLRDMLCHFIKARVYDTYDEEIMAFTFIIIQLEKIAREAYDKSRNARFAFTVVNHLGDYEIIPPNVDYHIFGCRDEEKIKKAKKNLGMLKIPKVEKLKTLREIPEYVIAKIMSEDPVRIMKVTDALKRTGIPAAEIPKKAKETIYKQIKSKQLSTMYWTFR